MSEEIKEIDHVLIQGDTGTGKSSGIETLDPKETFVINTDNKALPFPSAGYKTVVNNGELDYSKSNYVRLPAHKDNVIKVPKILRSAIQQPRIKTVVLDTITTPLVDYFMQTLDIKGKEIYGKFNKMGFYVYDILQIMANSTNTRVIIISHTDVVTDENGQKIEVMKSVGGKLADEKVKFPTRLNMVLTSKVKRKNKINSYVLETQSDGLSTTKSLRGLFDDFEIKNDLQYVIDCLDYYRNGGEKPKAPELNNIN